MKRKAEDTTKKQVDPWSKTISLRQLWSNRSNLGLTVVVILFITVWGLSILDINIADFKKNHEAVLSATSQSIPISNLIPLPTPTQKSVARQQPIVTQQTNPVQATPDPQQAPIRHDGSRTGPIVDYFELCTGKTIKVYENERIPYKRINGETVYSTKGDIKCYEDQIAQLKQQASQQNNYQGYSQPPQEPTITCVLSWGTYQLTQSICNTYKKMDSDFKETNDAIINQYQQASQQILNRTPPPFTPPTIPTPAPMPQFQQTTFDTFDTGMMCTRKAINNSAGGGGIIFIGSCI